MRDNKVLDLRGSMALDCFTSNSKRFCDIRSNKANCRLHAKQDKSASASPRVAPRER